jgi:cytochrome c oxidase subunit 4
MENKDHHIVPYKTYVIILAILVVFTAISVAVTSIELGALTATIALLLASVKGILVLTYFMHLKFDERIFAIMVTGILLLIIIVIIITFLDYFFR